MLRGISLLTERLLQGTSREAWRERRKKLFAHAVSCVSVKHGSNAAVVDTNGKSQRVDMVDCFLLAVTMGRATRDGLTLAASRTAKPGRDVDNIADGRWRDWFLDKKEGKEAEAASG